LQATPAVDAIKAKEQILVRYLIIDISFTGDEVNGPFLVLMLFEVL